MQPGPHRIEVVIAEGFSMVSLSLVTDPLRIANRESPRPLFRWRLLSADGCPVRSSSGLTMAVDGGLDEQRAEAVVLIASYGPERMLSARLGAWLRRHAARGTLMGCVETGAMIFAEAGLLTRRPAAAHHESIAGFRERYGDALFADKLVDLGGDRCSSAGGVATFDMTLALIGHFASRPLALRVAEVLNYRPMGQERAAGAFGRDWALPRLNRDLARAVELMMANLDRPLRVTEIAARLGLPDWRLRRLFHRYLRRAPSAYYLTLRLDHARNLLRNSHEPVGKIALLAGFDSSESFSRAYRRQFDCAPSTDRAP